MTPGVNWPVSGTAITAARPPSSAASTHVNVDNRRTLMPTSSVAVGSWLAPMMASPRLVRVKNTPSKTASTARVPINHSRWSEISHVEHGDAIDRRERLGDRTALVVEEPLLDGDREQCDAGRGDEQGHAGRLEERADDDPLGEEAEQHRRQQSTDHGEAVRDVVGVQQVQGAQRDGAELTLGEVEDAARLVDEHEPESDHAVGRAGHRADDDRLLLARDDQHRDQDRGETEADQQPGALLQQFAHAQPAETNCSAVVNCFGSSVQSASSRWAPVPPKWSSTVNSTGA